MNKNIFTHLISHFMKTTIGKIGNYYGELEVKKELGLYFWGIEDCSRMSWEEISETLYLELLKHNDK